MSRSCRWTSNSICSCIFFELRDDGGDLGKAAGRKQALPNAGALDHLHDFSENGQVKVRAFLGRGHREKDEMDRFAVHGLVIETVHGTSEDERQVFDSERS